MYYMHAIKYTLCVWVCVLYFSQGTTYINYRAGVSIWGMSINTISYAAI